MWSEKQNDRASAMQEMVLDRLATLKREKDEKDEKDEPNATIKPTRKLPKEKAFVQGIASKIENFVTTKFIERFEDKTYASPKELNCCVCDHCQSQKKNLEG